MPAPAAILDLVARFGEHIDAYKSGSYNETQLRRDYLDPLFKELGWDIDNTAGYAEAYRDVIHEDQVKVGRALKAPDYGFRIGGQRKFFLEAKKPSVRIKDDVSPAYQLRRYAWSAKLPLSILSDFEEFAIYDTRIKPFPSDPASKARIFYCRFDEYAQHWDHIAGIFSIEAIRKGSFDKYAASVKGKRGTAEVDADFLATIEGWRADLARNLALRNPTLTQRELNFSVQRVLDRLIFLRICEDRGIEDYERLKRATDAKGIYPALVKLFQQADDRYNSGLFHFHSEKGRHEDHDALTPHLIIDDALLKPLIRGLYYPESPYEFSVFTADILGQVYEQFLGKVITLTAGHRAVVEDKPEVKKAGGVFYTPTYIVEYIVKQTVGPLIEGKTPKQIEKVRVLDPACGSGSFLIGAYQYLLDWYHRHYTTHEPTIHAKGKSPRLVAAQGGGWALTTTERKRILLTHIYGVDIDSQAVEVTKLSLLLKVLEGETAQTVQRELIQERVLPDLGDNIKCGNSLIGSDFYAQADLPEMDADAHLRINVFDWDGKDGFPEIMKAGGFDAVIGNPPYVRIQVIKETSPDQAEFLKTAYRSASQGNYDLYVVFVEKALKLLNPQARMGFIVPHKFGNSAYGAPLRALIAEGRNMTQFVHFGDQQVFEGATTYTGLLFMTRKPQKKFRVIKVNDLEDWRTNQAGASGDLAAEELGADEWNFVVGPPGALFRRLDALPVKLGDIAASMFVGLQTSADTVYLFKDTIISPGGVTKVVSKETGETVQIESSILRPVVRSGDIGRYQSEATAVILFPYEVDGTNARLYAPVEMEKKFPKAWAYLNRNKAMLAGREKGKFDDAEWYRFGRNQNLGMWEQKKLMVPYMVTRLACYLDQDDEYYFINVTTGGYGITVREPAFHPHYVCALLNSSLLNFFFKQVSTNFHGGYFAANKQFIDRLPIRVIDPKNKPDQAAHDRIVAHVEKMLSLYRQRAAAKTPHEQTVLDRQIGSTDANIDREVYALYNLTPEEIAFVEGSATPEEEVPVLDATPTTASILDATLEYPHREGYTGHMVFREDLVAYSVARQSTATTQPENARHE